jgi:hypothetical protein
VIDCALYATLPTAGPEADCTKVPGLSAMNDEDLQALREQQAHALGGDAGSVFKFPVCVVQQLSVEPGSTCHFVDWVGWCYVQNTSGASPAGNCGAGIALSAGVDTHIKGATYSFACKR